MPEKGKKGKKTLALAGMAGAAAMTAAVDPSGISIATFLVASAGAVAGASYHAVRKVVTLLKDDEPVDTSSHEQFDPVQLEECVRKIASSITGISISGMLALVLPHTLVGAALNVREFFAELRKLQKMARSQGMGSRDLLHTIRKRDIATQFALGIAIKVAFTAMFLGSDFDTWAKHIGHVLSSGGAPSGERMATVLQAASVHHQNLTSHGLLAATTAISNGPGDAVTEILTGSTSSVTWHDGTGGGVRFEIGVVTAATDVMLARLSEEPVHQAVTSAYKGRN